MQQTKLHPKTFVTLSFMVMALIFPIYFLVIDIWLVSPNANIPVSYKELLLAKTPGKKIIIDSGSNSYFGIDTILLGRHFRMPAINMADNAEYPLRHKFNYLVRYAKEGDIILLPLEWQHYTHSALYDHYVAHVLQGELSYYYNSMSLVERIYFVNSVRINLFLSAVLKRLSNPPDQKWAIKKLNDFNARLQMNQNTSFGSVLREPGIERPENKAGPGGCDQYIFKRLLQNGFSISDEFKEALGILAKAAEKGVTIVFTWPAVVDREDVEACYSDANIIEKMKEFSKSIRNLIQKHGFMFIGTPEESHFSSNYYYDTFFHLNEEGSKIRTRRLIELMESSGIEADTGDYSPEKTLQQLASLIGDL